MYINFNKTINSHVTEIINEVKANRMHYVHKHHN